MGHKLLLSGSQLCSNLHKVHIALAEFSKHLALFLFHVVLNVFPKHLDVRIEQVVVRPRSFDLADQLLQGVMLDLSFVQQALALIPERFSGCR